MEGTRTLKGSAVEGSGRGVGLGTGVVRAAKTDEGGGLKGVELRAVPGVIWEDMFKGVCFELGAANC